MTGGPSISRREGEVLAALGERMTNAEIADRLFISVRTVESHVSALLRKFDVHSRRELAEVGARVGTAPVRRPLPTQLTATLGRADDITAAAALVRQSRIVTLTGPAGVGKTRLAVEVADAVTQAVGADVCFVDLTPAIDEATVVTSFAAALDTTADAGSSTRTGVLHSLRTAGELLLVVDNCEHILEAVAQLVSDAVSGSPDVRILATSREMLGVPGERVFSVNPLDAASAAELFWERAVSVDPAVRVDEATAAEAVRSICERLDGMPLAIELAAAQAPSLTPQQIDARLGERFSLLRSPMRAGTRRHAGLETALAWSYDLLDPRERVLLDRVSVFRGRFGLDAVEAVASGPPVPRDAILDLLGRLVRKSLVVAETVGDERRFRLLETIREYGWARLEAAGELAAWRQCHLEWVFTLLETAAVDSQRGEQTRSFANLDEELPNIESALEWSIRSPADAARALTAVDRLHTYWLVGGIRRREGLRWLHATSEAATAMDAAPRTRSLVDAVLLLTLDDLHAARAAADQARLVAGDDPLAKAYASLASAIVTVHSPRGGVDPGLLDAIEALEPDDRLHWWARGIHAFDMGRSGRHAEAVAELREVLDGFHAVGDEHLAEGNLNYIADMEWAAGDVEAARTDTARALDAARRFDCASCEALAVANLVLMNHGHSPEDRLALARQSLQLAWRIGETWSVLASLDLVAGVLADQKQLRDAVVVGSAAEALRAQAGYHAVLPTRAAEVGRGLRAARTRLVPNDVADLEREGMSLTFESAVAVATG